MISALPSHRDDNRRRSVSFDDASSRAVNITPVDRNRRRDAIIMMLTPSRGILIAALPLVIGIYATHRRARHFGSGKSTHPGRRRRMSANRHQI